MEQSRGPKNGKKGQLQDSAEYYYPDGKLEVYRDNQYDGGGSISIPKANQSGWYNIKTAGLTGVSDNITKTGLYFRRAPIKMALSMANENFTMIRPLEYSCHFHRGQRAGVWYKDDKKSGKKLSRY